MNRREFSTLLGLGTLAGAVGGNSLADSSGPDSGKLQRLQRKAWAREHFRGFENVLMPSFTLNLEKLDENGIRLDVRKSIEHGFFSTLCAPIALSLEETKRFLEVAVDEAQGRIAIGLALHADTQEEEFELLAHAEQVGCQHALLDLPNEGSQDDLYQYGAKYAEATNLGLYLWQAQKHGFRRFNAAGIPHDVYDRLAEHPNIIALKVGDPNPAVLFELFERYNDRMLIGAMMLNIMPLGIKAYGQQWSGAWTVEALQSPEKPYAVNFFNLMMAGQYKEGMELYWGVLAPAFGAMMQRMGPLMPSGGHPWEHLKYYQFAVGGNGGRMRKDPKQPNLPEVSTQDMEQVRQTFRMIGIEPSDLPDEAFSVGRINYQNGARAGDVS